MEKVRLVTFRGTEEQIKKQEGGSRPFGVLNPNLPPSSNSCEVEVEDLTSVDLSGKKPFIFKYINWKDVIGTRKVIPIHCKFEVNEYHGESPLWLLKAYDLDKCEIRYFDLSKINKEELK